jgi:hypothetical protein
VSVDLRLDPGPFGKGIGERLLVRPFLSQVRLKLTGTGVMLKCPAWLARW